MMKRLLVFILFICSAFAFARTPVFADYNQAYQNYLINFDLYRTKYTEFQVAKNEYKKFKTLTSQATALEKTKALLRQRDELLRTYLLTLNEKINDPDAGLQSNLKQQYQSLLTSEIIFLETQSARVPSVGSLDDADDLSRELESHYMVLQTSIRQILIGLSLGQLAIAARHYDEMLKQVNTIVQLNQFSVLPAEQETIKRWLLQIDTKRNFYQQKVDALTLTNAQLKVPDYTALDTKYNQMIRGAGEARQYLVEGVSFIAEVRNALKYE